MLCFQAIHHTLSLSFHFANCTNVHDRLSIKHCRECEDRRLYDKPFHFESDLSASANRVGLKATTQFHDFLRYRSMWSHGSQKPPPNTPLGRHRWSELILSKFSFHRHALSVPFLIDSFLLALFKRKHSKWRMIEGGNTFKHGIARNVLDAG